MHQRNSHQHHYFRIDVSGGRDETTDRVSQLKHYPILSSLIIYFSADQTWSSTWSILLYQKATGLHFFDIPDASLILVIFSPPHFFLLGIYAITLLHVHRYAGHSYGLGPSLCKHILYYVKIHTGRPVRDCRPPGLTLAFGAHVFANTPCSHSNPSDEPCKKRTLSYVVLCFMYGKILNRRRVKKLQDSSWIKNRKRDSKKMSILDKKKQKKLSESKKTGAFVTLAIELTRQNLTTHTGPLITLVCPCGFLFTLHQASWK